MKLTSEQRRNFLRTCGSLSLSALALSAVSRGVLAQGYGSGQNGGSSTMQGQGTRGGTQVDGSGPGGPRDRMNNMNNQTTSPSGTSRDPNLATGTKPQGTDPHATDTSDPNMNPRGTRRSK